MIDERELEEYRKYRADGCAATQSLRYARHKLRTEFEKNLRGFSFIQDRRNDSLWYAELDGDRYKVLVEYDDECSSYDQGFIVENKKPYEGKYPRECVTEVGRNSRSQWLVIEDETPSSCAKYYHNLGYSKQVSYEKAVESILCRRKYYVDLVEGNTSPQVVAIKGHGVDECCGGVEEYVEEFIWETLS